MISRTDFKLFKSDCILKVFFIDFLYEFFFPHEMNSLFRDVLEGGRGGHRPPKNFRGWAAKKLKIVKNLISKFLTMIILIIKLLLFDFDSFYQRMTRQFKVTVNFYCQSKINKI